MFFPTPRPLSSAPKISSRCARVPRVLMSRAMAHRPSIFRCRAPELWRRRAALNIPETAIFNHFDQTTRSGRQKPDVPATSLRRGASPKPSRTEANTNKSHACTKRISGACCMRPQNFTCSSNLRAFTAARSSPSSGPPPARRDFGKAAFALATFAAHRTISKWALSGIKTRRDRDGEIFALDAVRH